MATPAPNQPVVVDAARAVLASAGLSEHPHGPGGAGFTVTTTPSGRVIASWHRPTRNTHATHSQATAAAHILTHTIGDLLNDADYRNRPAVPADGPDYTPTSRILTD